MSDVKYDAEICERLEREAREDAATIRLVDELFARPDATWPECGHDESTCPCFTENDKARSALAKATLRTRDNLRAMADQLAAARAEIAAVTAERDDAFSALDECTCGSVDRGQGRR